MSLSVCKSSPTCIKHSTFFLRNLVFTFLWSKIRIHVIQFLCSDESDIFGRIFDIVVLDSHVFLLYLAERCRLRTVYEVSMLRSSLEMTLFPVPLVNIYRMDVVWIFITTDRDHICVKSFAVMEAIISSMHIFSILQENERSQHQYHPVL